MRRVKQRPARLARFEDCRPSDPYGVRGEYGRRSLPMRANLVVPFLTVILAGCAMSGPRDGKTMEPPAPAAERVFELRTYTASPGKLAALHARFRDHTNALFRKHGMTVIGFFSPTEGERQQDTLVYLLAFPDRAAREHSWQAFRDDP